MHELLEQGVVVSPGVFDGYSARLVEKMGFQACSTTGAGLANSRMSQPDVGIMTLTKTMIGITFIAGLLPVVGNLISNTVIVIVSLAYSLYVAVASLVFLVVIHKLEYFLNAKIIGTRIQTHAWELLVAMLAMEAAFGLAGVVAAPIFYAYVKAELADRGLI